MALATAPRQPTRGLAAADLIPSRPPAPRPVSLLDAARVLAAADGRTLDRLRQAALALKRGDESEARVILLVEEPPAADPPAVPHDGRPVGWPAYLPPIPPPPRRG